MHYVIIGGSAAGISCVEAIRSCDTKSPISLISDETLPLYSRCLLSYYLAGTLPEGNLHFKDADFFRKHAAHPLLGIRAEAVEVKAGKVRLGDNRTVAFDRLLVATGARSKMLEIPGIGKEGVFALRTVQDAKAIEGRLAKTRTAVILGGGLIGLKAAYALKSRGGIDVTVVIASDQVLSQMLDTRAASLIQGRIEEKGIRVLKGRGAKEVLGGDSVEGVLLDDGSTLACGLVLVGKGVEPNTEIAKLAGIGVRKGITANEFLETDREGIFAAGDAAETHDITTGKPALNALWPCAVEQGKIAGRNMAGKRTRYGGSLGMNSVEFFGLPVISMGVTRPREGRHEELVAYDAAKGTYKKVILEDGVIRGFISVGRVENSGVYNALIRNEIDVSEIREALLDKDFSYAKAMPLVKKHSDRFANDEFRDSIITF